MPGKKCFLNVFALSLLLSMILSACGPAWVEAPTAVPTQAPTATAAPTATEAPTLSSAATEDPAGTPAPAETAAASTAQQAVEVFSPWTAGSEAVGLEALVKLFKEKYPNTELANPAVTAQPYTEALAARLASGQLPDAWQVLAGPGLTSIAQTGQLRSLDDLIRESGNTNHLPAALLDTVSWNGSVYAMPVSVRRANLIWYNISVLERTGASVPTSLEEWFATLQNIQSQGVTPLVLGDQTTAMLLMENIFLTTLGPQKYSDLWTGKLAWDGPDVTAAIENFKKVLAYANPDAASLTWKDAAQRLANGEAAFMVMADWMDPFLKDLKKVPQEDFGWAPMPGTAGTFLFLADAFVSPIKAAHTEVVSWLALAGSKEGQDAFNPAAGSIPARTDADASLYDPYQRSAMADWAKDTLAGSLTYGMVASDAWKNAIGEALAAFLKDQDTTSFQAKLVEACKAGGSCQ